MKESLNQIACNLGTEHMESIVAEEGIQGCDYGSFQYGQNDMMIHLTKSQLQKIIIDLMLLHCQSQKQKRKSLII